jgi:FkbM family methyltransferase
MKFTRKFSIAKLNQHKFLYQSVSQHPVFRHFKPFEGMAPRGNCDFSGAVDIFNFSTEPDFPSIIEKVYQSAPMLNADEEIFEWIDILDSALNCSESFVFVELGAGYGRWAARAYKIAKMLDLSDSNIHLITVEPELRHSAWLHEHFKLNSITCNHHHFECAVSDFEGDMDFYVQRPSDMNVKSAASQWFGQALAHSGWKNAAVEKVRVERFETILNSISNLRTIDLIDLDLQGEDYKVLSDSVEILESRVKKVHVGTDSKEEEKKIRELFRKLEWDPVWDHQTTGLRRTEFGLIQFVDGVQTYTNPRLYKINRANSSAG